MKVIFWCILLALIAVPTVRAVLTTGEKTSLQSILDTFPSLSAVPRQYSYLDDSFVGGSWPMNGFDHVCEAPGEYFQIYGVLCKNGHVVGLGLNVGWGHNVSATFDATGFNLDHMNHTHYTDSIAPSQCFMEAVLRDSTSLKSVRVKTSSRLELPRNFGMSGATIETLDLDLQQKTSPNFGQFTALKRFRYMSSTDVPMSLLNLTHLANKLESIETSHMRNIANLSLFVALKELDAAFWDETFQDQPLIIPNSLARLSLKAIPKGKFSVDVSSGISSLTEAKFTLGNGVVTSLPSSLRTLSIGDLVSLDSSFNLTQLTDLSLTSAYEELTKANWLALSTSLQSLTLIEYYPYQLDPLKNLTSMRLPLKKLEISEGYDWDLSNFESLLCLIDRSTLLELKVDLNDAQGIPSCMSEFTSLQSVDFNLGSHSSHLYHSLKGSSTTLKRINIRGRATIVDLSTIGINFPSLVELSLEYSGTAVPFPDTLLQLRNLKFLKMTGMRINGTLPVNMFGAWPNLVGLELNGNSLTGPIPVTNIPSSLRVLDLSENKFTSFSVTAPTNLPNMAHLTLSNNMLTTLPTNQVFNTMKKIEYFYVQNNPRLSAPLPQFWRNSTTLKVFDASNCNFTGPIARSVDAPRLREIKFSKNRLCGPLPDIYPLSSINFLDLSHNRFSGTIPSSWTLFYINRLLNLQNNSLSGTLANPTGLSMPDGFFKLLDFRYNNFTGGLFNFSTTPLYYLYFANTNIDPCANNPLFRSRFSVDLANRGAWCNCPAYYSPAKDVTEITCPSGSTFSDPVYIGVEPTYCDAYRDEEPEPEPVAEEPVAEEPVAEEPVAEEPAPISGSPTDALSSSPSLLPLITMSLGLVLLHCILM